MHIGRDLYKHVAVGKILAGQPVFFWSEDDRDLSAAMELPLDEGREFVETHNRLFCFAMGQCACSKDKRAIAQCVGEGCGLLRIGEQLWCAYG